MQPATVHQVASEAALLSREQLQSLARAANVLGREVEEVTSDVTNYVQQLQGLTPAAQPLLPMMRFSSGWTVQPTTVAAAGPPALAGLS